MGRFSYKNILVVGGSSGIGLDLVRLLVKENAVVFVASRSNPEPLSELKLQHFTFDATLPDVSVFNALPEKLDGLVYCPGTINLKPFTRLKEEDFKNDFQINVIGAVLVLQALIGRLKNSPSASVLFYSTVASSTGMAFHASIAASKSALEGLARSLAAEYAANRIRFNTIAPSLTNTSLAKQLISTPEKLEVSNKRHPLGRIGEVGDISSISTFLLSDESSWITGQVLHVDGGLSTIKSM